MLNKLTIHGSNIKQLWIAAFHLYACLLLIRVCKGLQYINSFTQQDYSEMSMAYRPSHADATYDFKYGTRSVEVPVFLTVYEICQVNVFLLDS